MPLDNTGAELVRASDVNWSCSSIIMSTKIHVDVTDGTPIVIGCPSHRALLGLIVFRPGIG